MNKQNNLKTYNLLSKTKSGTGNLPEKNGVQADIGEFNPDNIVGMYMTEMAREPLLSYADEQRLGQQIACGQQAAKALKRGNNSPAVTDQLKRKVKQGQKARNHLVKANTRLVVSVAKRYLHHGVPMLDLIQGGNVALIRATEKFDHSRGYRFSTYATWWIRQGVTRTLAEQKRVFRIPIYMNDRIINLRKVAAEMEKTQTKKPTVKELAKELEIEPKTVRLMLTADKGSLSLDKPIKGDNDAHLGDFLENTGAPNPVQHADQQLLKEKLEDLLLTLSPREARILSHRFGLYNRPALTLEEIGQKFDLTRERIRQIERKALRKLRHPSRAYQVRAYWR